MTTQHLDRPGIPADWYADPVGRHQYRFYDGLHWTDHVANDGRVQLDPLNPAPPLEPAVVIPADEAPAPQPERPSTVPPKSEQSLGAGQPGDEPLILAPETLRSETVPSTPESLLKAGPASSVDPGLPDWPAAGSPAAASAAPVTLPQPTPAAQPLAAPTPLPVVMPPVTEWERAALAPMLSLDEAVRRCLRGYVSFAGRASRSEYWWFALTANLASGVVAFAGVVIFGGLVGDPTVASVLSRLPYVLLGLGLLLPMLAAAVRRLHDTGRSGTMLLLGLIPLVGPIILLVFLASPGTPGANQYGTTPTPVGDAPQLLPTIIAAARIPLQYLLIGIASLMMFRFVSYGQVGLWGLWSNGLSGWLLMTLTIAAAVAFMFAMRHTIPSRWLLWLEVATAAVIAAAPWGAATLWFDWPELLSAPLLIIFGRVFAMAWLCVVLVSAFPRLQVTPGATT